MMGKLENDGLYGKYKVEKADGTPVDPEAVYFVLRVDTDGEARRALRVYAWLGESENPYLSYDLHEWLDHIEDGLGLNSSTQRT